jgi:bifunctional oligoribonuclease and PAP phosphatase NrnA
MSRRRVPTEGINMELSPKQQAVNEIKKATNVLILGHKKPDGDHLGSMLALGKALTSLNKKVEIIASDKIDSIFNFLPGREDIKPDFKHTDGKIIKIDTDRIPIKGMKWQREDNFLNIYLDTDKNLKFEFIEINNGLPKPDLVIIINTPDVEKIDSTYDKNTELFFEVPIINIDHHPGNEYFGSINLIDLTATSTAEILVSLLEALGIKIDDGDIATNLLAGIIYSTQSFRNQNTTPKSLTVAAQLLAAGAKQQEIISNFYKRKPVELLKMWGEMLANIEEDHTHRFAWTKVDAVRDDSISKEDIFGAADDLLTNTPEADVILILYRGASDPNTIFGKLKGSKNKEVLSIAKLFSGSGTTFDAHFEYKGDNLDDTEKNILKKIADSWQEDETQEKQEVWDIIESKPNETLRSSDGRVGGLRDISAEKLEKPNPQEDSSPTPETKPNKNDLEKKNKDKEDAIEEALKSISQIEKDKDRRELTAIREVIDLKKNQTGYGEKVTNNISNTSTEAIDDEIDVFEENEGQ